MQDWFIIAFALIVAFVAGRIALALWRMDPLDEIAFAVTAGWGLLSLAGVATAVIVAVF